jgi:thymidylate kinase
MNSMVGGTSARYGGGAAAALRSGVPDLRPAPAAGDSGAREVPGARGLVADVLCALRERGIRYCVLRDGHELGFLEHGGELDLLVDPRHRARFRDLVGALGFVPLQHRGYAPHRPFLGYDAERDAWLKLDAVDSVAYGSPVRSLRTSLGSTCLDNRREREGVFVPAPEDEFVTLLLHCVLDKRRFDDRRRERLLLLCREIRDGERVASLLYDYGTPSLSWPALAHRIKAGQWDWLLEERPALERRLRARRRIGTRTREIRALALRKLDRALLRPRGVSLALLAPDGAGKSTLAAGLARAFPLRTRSIYMGLYPSNAKRSFFERLPGGGLPARLVRQWTRYLKARYQLARGRFVIFDRYAYDALLKPTRPLSRAKRARRWLLAHALPAPDRTVILDAPGELLYARKGEHDVDALNAQRREYLRVARRIPRSIVVDATRDPNVVRREVTRMMWRAYALRCTREGRR